MTRKYLGESSGDAGGHQPLDGTWWNYQRRTACSNQRSTDSKRGGDRFGVEHVMFS